MYLHLIDVQQEHSTSTQGKALSVTVRWETAVGKNSPSYNTVVLKLLISLDILFSHESDINTFFTTNILTCLSRKSNAAIINYTCVWKVKVSAVKRVYSTMLLYDRLYRRCCTVCTHFWMSQPCFPGLVSSEDRVDCRLCPAGFSCDPANGTLSLCPPGQYSPEGVRKCLTCPVDSICTSGFPIKVTITAEYLKYKILSPKMF